MSKSLLPTPLISDLRKLIETSKGRVAVNLNHEMVILYWQLGYRIRTEILQQKRASYGQDVVPALARKLTADYGRGYSRPALFRMIRFAEFYPDAEIISTLSRQLTWSHLVEILPLKEPSQRDFYLEMCRLERWSVRTLRNKIQGMLFERTALSKKPEKLIRQELDRLRETDQMTPDLILRDPYLLDFLGLKETFSERDLESAILQHLTHFILELGSDFSFLARQKRITIGSEDFYIDLLFYHRGLRRLIVIELKLGTFRAADKGQVELYLRWLDRYERRDGEEAPLGIILCAGKDEQQVELLQLQDSGIHVAEYLTSLPPRDLLERKLRAAILLAREGAQVFIETEVGEE